MAYGSMAAYGPGSTFAQDLVKKYPSIAQAQQQPQPPVLNSTLVAQPTNSTATAPYNATYASNENMIGASLGDQLASIEAQKPGLYASFGYTPTGQLDQSDPFSQAMQLQRSYDQSKTGNTNRYAARGQLYAGALQNAQNNAQYRYQAGDANLRGQLGQQLGQLSLAQASAVNDAAKQRDQNNFNLTNTTAQPGNYGATTYQALPQVPNNGVSDIPGVSDQQYQQTYGQGSNWQNAWTQAFQASHGGLTPEEYNYLQAQYQAAQRHG